MNRDLVIPNMMGYYYVCPPPNAPSTKSHLYVLRAVQPKQAPLGANVNQPHRGQMESSVEGQGRTGSSQKRSEEY